MCSRTEITCGLLVCLKHIWFYSFTCCAVGIIDCGLVGKLSRKPCDSFRYFDSFNSEGCEEEMKKTKRPVKYWNVNRVINCITEFCHLFKRLNLCDLRFPPGLQTVAITFGLLPSVAFLWFVTNVSGPYIRPNFRVQWQLPEFFLQIFEKLKISDFIKVHPVVAELLRTRQNVVLIREVENVTRNEDTRTANRGVWWESLK